MITEILSRRQEEVRLGLADSQISSIRNRAVTETAARVYRDGHIGIASAIGAADPDALVRRATQALRFPIRYAAPTPETASVTSDTLRAGTWRGTDALVAFTETILKTLREEFPQFVFSNSISCSRVIDTLQDNRGRTLRHEQVQNAVALVVKERGSATIFDTFVVEQHPDLTADGVLEACRAHLAAFLTPAERPEPDADGRHRVIFRGLQGSFYRTLNQQLSARAYATGSSIFSGKLGESIFNERFSLIDSRDGQRHACCPFDAEGTLRTSAECALIEGGVLRRIAASRQDATRYGLTPTGSAVGGLTSPPGSGLECMELAPTAPDLTTLLDGKPGLMVWFEAGGDINRAGDVGLPAMVLLRVDPTGRPVGRVPAGTLSGSLFQIFGDDFIGVTEQPIGPFSSARFVVTRMHIQD